MSAATIPLMGTPYQPANPVQQLSQLAQVQNLLQAGPQEAQLRQQQIDQNDYELKQRQAINNAYKSAVNVDPATGQPSFDTNALTKTLAASGHGEAIPQIMKGINDYQKSHVDLQEAQQKVDTSSRDAAGAAGYAIRSANYDPGLTTSIIQHQLATPNLDPQHQQMYNQMLQAIQQDPSKVKPLADQMVAMSPKYTELASQDEANKARALAAQTGQQRLQAEMPGGPLANVDRSEMTSWQQKQQAAGKPSSPADFMAYKASLAPTIALNLAAQAGGGLSKPAVDNAAEQYFQTGTLPPSARGTAGLAQNRAIMNRAAELHPGESLPESTAAYAANKGSLKNVQENFDQMNAFENTGLKNLDLFLDKASKIPDLGTRFANTPLRLITGKMIGTDQQAAMEAARVTASKEVAKVLSSAKGSGVLSDSQSKEVDDILAGNLSLSAMKSVVGTLKQDMANRHESYQQQIQDIQQRLGGRGNQTQTPQTTKPLSITLPSGKKISIE